MKKENINISLQALKTVFKNPSYTLIALVIATTILIFAIWLPNLGFVLDVIQSSTYSIGSKFNILWSSLGAFKTNFTLETQVLTVTVALLTGMNMAVLVFYLKKRTALERSVGTSTLGTVVGLLGVGCASCGSVILSSIFGLSATASFIGFFPLNGAEFGIIGILLLLFSTYTLLKKVEAPLVCKV